MFLLIGFQWMITKVKVKNLQYEMGIFTTGLQLNWCVLSQGWRSRDWYGIVIVNNQKMVVNKSIITSVKVVSDQTAQMARLI